MIDYQVITEVNKNGLVMAIHHIWEISSGTYLSSCILKTSVYVLNASSILSKNFGGDYPGCYYAARLNYFRIFDSPDILKRTEFKNVTCFYFHPYIH